VCLRGWVVSAQNKRDRQARELSPVHTRLCLCLCALTRPPHLLVVECHHREAVGGRQVVQAGQQRSLGKANGVAWF
jgi:hypothetical protein